MGDERPSKPSNLKNIVPAALEQWGIYYRLWLEMAFVSLIATDTLLHRELRSSLSIRELAVKFLAES
jgi:hypothetical protein